MSYRKTKLIALLLALSQLGPLTACSTQEPAAIHQQAEQTKPSASTSKNEVVSLKDINPKFTPSGAHIKIDEDSLYQIVSLAMKDARDFYVGMGAPNMQYDKNLQIKNGEGEFYPEWMNEAFFMARAMSESSLRIDCMTQISGSTTDTHAKGIMQICENSTKDTLEQYFQSVFGVTKDLDQLKIIPSKQDLEELYYSEEAKQNVLRNVYNNVYISILYDVYDAKCKNPVKHENYYSKYGGFSEEMRKFSVTIGYTAGNGFALEGMINGNLREKTYEIPAYSTYMHNMNTYQKRYESKYLEKTENQPGN